MGRRKARERVFSQEEKNEILKQYFRLVYRIAFNLRRRRFSADDLAQEAFLKIVKEIDLFDGRTNLQKYIAMIARQRIRQVVLSISQRLEREKQAIIWFSNDPGENFFFSHKPDKRAPKPSEEAHTGLLTERVMAQVSQLKERHRKALILRIEGLEFKQIGDELGVTKERARQLHNRAIKIVREALAQPDAA